MERYKNNSFIINYVLSIVAFRDSVQMGILKQSNQISPILNYCVQLVSVRSAALPWILIKFLNNYSYNYLCDDGAIESSAAY